MLKESYRWISVDETTIVIPSGVRLPVLVEDNFDMLHVVMARYVDGRWSDPKVRYWVHLPAYPESEAARVYKN